MSLTSSDIKGYADPFKYKDGDGNWQSLFFARPVLGVVQTTNNTVLPIWEPDTSFDETTLADYISYKRGWYDRDVIDVHVANLNDDAHNVLYNPLRRSHVLVNPIASVDHATAADNFAETEQIKLKSFVGLLASYLTSEQVECEDSRKIGSSQYSVIEDVVTSLGSKLVFGSGDVEKLTCPVDPEDIVEGSWKYYKCSELNTLSCYDDTNDQFGYIDVAIPGLGAPSRTMKASVFGLDLTGTLGTDVFDEYVSVSSSYTAAGQMTGVRLNIYSTDPFTGKMVDYTAYINVVYTYQEKTETDDDGETLITDSITKVEFVHVESKDVVTVRSSVGSSTSVKGAQESDNVFFSPYNRYHSDGELAKITYTDDEISAMDYGVAALTGNDSLIWPTYLVCGTSMTGEIKGICPWGSTIDACLAGFDDLTDEKGFLWLKGPATSSLVGRTALVSFIQSGIDKVDDPTTSQSETMSKALSSIEDGAVLYQFGTYSGSGLDRTFDIEDFVMKDDMSSDQWSDFKSKTALSNDLFNSNESRTWSELSALGKLYNNDSDIGYAKYFALPATGGNSYADSSTVTVVTVDTSGIEISDTTAKEEEDYEGIIFTTGSSDDGDLVTYSWTDRESLPANCRFDNDWEDTDSFEDYLYEEILRLVIPDLFTFLDTKRYAGDSSGFMPIEGSDRFFSEFYTSTSKFIDNDKINTPEGKAQSILTGANVMKTLVNLAHEGLYLKTP